ncbi:MAG: DUF983 domain-containing protein [Kiloniellales bacterium]|nr:DUF983 domain-containing protein [Kiloniellales bacterium]
MSGVSPIGAGLRCKCPRCGRGALFSGVLKVNDACTACGLDLTKQDAGDGPAVFVIFILGALVVPLVLWVEFSFEPAFWLHLILWPPIILVSALAMLRPLKGLLIALQYRLKASDGGQIHYD